MVRFKIPGWEYLAGFTDGDGCISVPEIASKRPSQISVTWYQAEATSFVLDAIDIFLKDNGVSGAWYANDTNKMTYPSSQIMWHFRIQGAEKTEFVLKHLLPFLVIKKAKAKEALAILAKSPRGRRYERLITCQRGHDMTDPENVYVRPKGGAGRGRQCRSCMRIQEKRRNRGKAVSAVKNFGTL